jgi:hypothetical protein
LRFPTPAVVAPRRLDAVIARAKFFVLGFAQPSFPKAPGRRSFRAGGAGMSHKILIFSLFISSSFGGSVRAWASRAGCRGNPARAADLAAACIRTPRDDGIACEKLSLRRRESLEFGARERMNRDGLSCKSFEQV